MADINPYEPTSIQTDGSRFHAPVWLVRLIVYALVFNLSWDASRGTRFLLRWLNRTQPEFLFQLFVAAVISIPIYLIGHLIAPSNSNLTTIFRSIAAGLVFGFGPSETLQLERLPRWLSQSGFNFANVLYREQSHWLFDMLIALVAELFVVALLAIVLRNTFPRTVARTDG